MLVQAISAERRKARVRAVSLGRASDKNAAIDGNGLMYTA
jgi:hypothetical protein